MNAVVGQVWSEDENVLCAFVSGLIQCPVVYTVRTGRTHCPCGVSPAACQDSWTPQCVSLLTESRCQNANKLTVEKRGTYYHLFTFWHKLGKVSLGPG